MIQLSPEVADFLTVATHRAFALAMVGPEVAGVGPVEAAHLISLGLITRAQATNGYLVPTDEPMDPFMFAVTMGSIMVGEATEPGALRKAWEDVTALRSASLKRWIERVNFRLRVRRIAGRPLMAVRRGVVAPAHLSVQEAGAWLSARTRAGQYITAIGDKARIEVRDMVREAVADQLDWRQFEKRLNGRFGVYTRDWRRVARTELQGAYNEGAVAAAVSLGGMEQQIARVPEKDACEHCMRLFVENDRPKLFTARQLISNGTNVGRDSEHWLPTVWPVHPNCRCDTVAVPAGHGFDKRWNVVPLADVNKSAFWDPTPLSGGHTHV